MNALASSLKCDEPFESAWTFASTLIVEPPAVIVMSPGVMVIELPPTVIVILFGA